MTHSKHTKHQETDTAAVVAAPAATGADAWTLDDIAHRLQKTLDLLAQIHAIWPTLVPVPDLERVNHPGRSLVNLNETLTTLYGILLPARAPTDADAKKNLDKLVAAFQVLADEDDGYDPESFEIALQQQRIARWAAERQVEAALESLGRLFGDDVLVTGAQVTATGQKAFDATRSLSRQNAVFKQMLTPVLNLLGGMMKAARAGRAAKEKAAAQPATPPPATPATPPTTTNPQGNPTSK